MLFLADDEGDEDELELADDEEEEEDAEARGFVLALLVRLGDFGLAGPEFPSCDSMCGFEGERLRTERD